MGGLAGLPPLPHAVSAGGKLAHAIHEQSYWIDMWARRRRHVYYSLVSLLNAHARAKVGEEEGTDLLYRTDARTPVAIT